MLYSREQRNLVVLSPVGGAPRKIRHQMASKWPNTGLIRVHLRIYGYKGLYKGLSPSFPSHYWTLDYSVFVAALWLFVCTATVRHGRGDQ